MHVIRMKQYWSIVFLSFFLVELILSAAEKLLCEDWKMISVWRSCILCHSFIRFSFLYTQNVLRLSLRSSYTIFISSTKRQETRRKTTSDRMGSIVSSLSISSDQNRWLSSSLQSSQLVYRQTLSTCYDSIFDISFSSTKNLILVSDDGRLRLFEIDLDQNKPLIELNSSTMKVLPYEQVQDILWSTILDRFLVLTSKRLATYDQENNLVDLDLQLEKGLLSCSFLSLIHFRTHTHSLSIINAFRESTIVENGLLVNTSLSQF